jgi:small conductance mechanosensitive channel
MEQGRSRNDMSAMTEKVQEVLVARGPELGLNLLWAVLILVVGRIVAKALTALVRRAMKRGNVDETLTRFAGSLMYIILMVVVILAALDRLGVRTTSFVAILGAAGLAVGLALQGSLSNFAAGIMMMIFRPFKVGDFVEGGGTCGVVQEVGIFTTTMKTGDNKKIMVPNSKVIGDNITNFSANETRRIDLVVGVSYGDDLKKVRAVLESLLEADDRILKEPAWTVAVMDLAESSVNFVVRPWVRTGDYWPVRFDLTEAIKLRFDAEGITIPFPQRELHHTNEPAGA